MGSFGCPHEVNGTCRRVRGAICEPGMRGCVLVGKVEFPGGVIPAPRWPAAFEKPATAEKPATGEKPATARKPEAREKPATPEPAPRARRRRTF